ncbi:MAG: hypothetical protein R3D98_07690 [Candidatus Krumholzibacteriia bacterium]
MAIVTERWAGLRDELSAELDTVAAGYGRIRDGMRLVRNDLAEVGARAEIAGRDGRVALQLRQDDLRAERQHLQRRLAELELRLQALDAVVDSTTTEANASAASGLIRATRDEPAARR